MSAQLDPSWCPWCGGTLMSEPATGCRQPLRHRGRAFYVERFDTNSHARSEEPSPASPDNDVTRRE